MHTFFDIAAIIITIVAVIIAWRHGCKARQMEEKSLPPWQGRPRHRRR